MGIFLVAAMTTSQSASVNTMIPLGLSLAVGVPQLAAYLPANLSPAELDAIVADEVAAAGEGVSLRQMGQVIKAVNARAKGRADGATVAAKVKAALAP